MNEPAGMTAPAAAADPLREQALGLGMIVFLASESMLFAGMFALYAAGRATHPQAFAEGVDGNLLWVGTANKYVLLISSWCIAMAVTRLRAGRRRGAVAMMAATLGLGALFLGLKGYEYGHHLAAGEGPGAVLGGRAAESSFLVLYWLVTGTHAIHVMVGMVLIAGMGWMVMRRRLQASTLELAAWYWHLVDAMWIVIWPLFYLLGGHR